MKPSYSITLPPIGMGTFGSDHYTPEQVANAVRTALEVGYKMFDCASVYGNEAQIGEVFAKAFDDGVVKRDELTITSKVWNDMHGKGDVLLSCAKTLKDLQLDYLDLYFVHWPFPNYHAPFCDVDARYPDSRPFSADEFISVWRQMERLVDMGLVKNIAMSNMTIKKFEEVAPLCRIKPAAHQMELHPAFQQPALLDYCVNNGILPIGYCPIGSPNRPERDKAEGDVIDTQMPEIQAIAKQRGIHPAAVCLKWAATRGVVPIPFASRRENIINNLSSVSGDLLTDDEMQSIAKADENCRLVKGQVFLWEGATDWRDLWDE